MPFHWFDLLIVLVLGAGFFVGRKRGMSQELLDVLQWLMIVIIAALFYKPLAEVIGSYIDFTLLWLYIGSYLFLASLITLIFTWIRKAAGEKLVGSDFFGAGEYYLGMLAGTVRFACILIAVLALMNAKYITPEQMRAQARVQQDNFGDIAFPTFSTIQHGVFRESFAGPVITNYLRGQLISPVAPDKKLVQRQSIGRIREQAVQEAMMR